MKIEVGMYVRTKNENIGKITFISPLDNLINLDTESYAIGKHFIKKASFDIIDLIEEGDYVNGEYIIQVSKMFGLLFIETTYYDEASGEERHNFIRQEDIKSIVTKEQFEREKYVIGE